MEYVLRQTGNAARLLGVIALGFAFALGLYQIWELDTRWFVVTLVGIAGIGIAMCLVRIFSDFLLVAGLFCLPLSAFHKWIWPSNYAEYERGNFVYSGVLGIGLIDFVLDWLICKLVLSNIRHPRAGAAAAQLARCFRHLVSGCTFRINFGQP